VTLERLASDVRGGRVSPGELVRRSIDRIDALDRELRAVVARRDEAAMAEAEAMGAAIASGENPGPLAGLPLLVKDTEDVAGMTTTHGSLVHADDPPASRDERRVARLRRAGAIVVGKTNVPEFAFEGYTSNRAFGATCNPWAVEWSPGGSSGGSGAALAAGMVPLATATDGGGSVRIPAGFCGLAGLKPTNGVIGRDPVPTWMDLSTPGPLAASIDDLRLLLSIDAGPAPGDPTALPAWAREPDPPALPARVFAARRLAPWGPLPPAIEALFADALRVVEDDLALDVTPLESEDIFESGTSEAGTNELRNIDRDWITIVGAEHAHTIGRESIEANADRFTEEFLAAMREGLALSLEEYVAARRRRFDYVRALDRLLGDDGLLLTPTMCAEGWSPEGTLPGADRPGTPGSAYNTQAANITGHPALSVPAGRAPNGVPFGLQIIGPRFRDGLVLAMGAAWEEARPWPLVASGYRPFDA
jgi:Asp-tRNA(Asn)/Glu-tRNA(Gln) amidotransferase A subunit family amidase